MIFNTRVNGIPCKCQVTHFTPPVPATFDYPAEDSEFEYALLDSRGKLASWLDKYITPRLNQQLYDDFQIMKDADYFIQH